MRKLLKYAIVTAALVAVTSPRGIGAIHKVSASLDSTHLLMGNVTTLHIQAVADGDDGQLLLADDTITSAVEYRSIDFKGATSLNDGTKRLDYDVTIQAFDSGPHIIPPIPFMQGLDTAYTDALELNVTVPLNADTINDVTANSIDVLDPPNVEWTDDLPESVAKAMKYWPWILAGVMLIIAAIALWLILKRRKKQAEAEAELPPYNWAMLKLKEIRERNMFSSGQERL
ncbi:MAG: cytochrome c-type biogenesis protein CcmH, partial [Muribaculaceae bacterium]|nr:cytochrome c-type biogenesis protein CcmH [Muribaculaceae bacterium]